MITTVMQYIPIRTIFYITEFQFYLIDYFLITDYLLLVNYYYSSLPTDYVLYLFGYYLSNYCTLQHLSIFRWKEETEIKNKTASYCNICIEKETRQILNVFSPVHTKRLICSSTTTQYKQCMKNKAPIIHSTSQYF